MTARERPWDAARRYAAAGWPVFPCRFDSKEPATEHGFMDATTDPERIDWWWGRRDPEQNVAIATGAPGPDVLDIDQHGEAGNGFAALNRLKRAGLVPAPTAVARTPSGGLHLYFAGTDQRNGSVPREHVDHRGAGGYVVAPPSRVGGRPYEVVSHQAVSNELDWQAARDFLAPRQARPQRQLPQAGQPEELESLARWVASRREGNRSQGLYWAACRASEHGLLDAAAEETLVVAALQAGIKGGEREARQKIAYARQAPPPSVQHDRSVRRAEPGPFARAPQQQAEAG